MLLTCLHMCGIFACDCTKKKKNACTLHVFGDVLCVVVAASNDLFFPITLLHTCGSFTFMVIQIMKLSIQEILWWEQWTQLPPAACEMGWQTLRQMGEAAVGRQSNHIHLACFPFPLFMCSAATYQQAGAKEPGIITLHTNNSANTHIPWGPLDPRNVPPLFPTTNKHLRFLSSFTSDTDLKSSHTSPAGGAKGGKQRVFWGEVISAFIPISLSANQALTRNILNDLYKTLKIPFSTSIF